jgi:hypothetical protein
MSEITATREIVYKSQRAPREVVENDATLLASAEISVQVQIITSAEVTPRR